MSPPSCWSFLLNLIGQEPLKNCYFDWILFPGSNWLFEVLSPSAIYCMKSLQLVSILNKRLKKDCSMCKFIFIQHFWHQLRECLLRSRSSFTFVYDELCKNSKFCGNKLTLTLISFSNSFLTCLHNWSCMETNRVGILQGLGPGYPKFVWGHGWGWGCL